MLLVFHGNTKQTFTCGGTAWRGLGVLWTSGVVGGKHAHWREHRTEVTEEDFGGDLDLGGALIWASRP